jgi:amino acid transporter
MAAGEVKRPRIYVKAAFKTAFWRFAFFFLGSALCVSVIISHRDPTLAAILGGSGEGGGTAAASPYVIAMKNMQIGVLPHIVNALLVTSIFSAGNTYTYCAIRSLYSLALEGQAPAFLKKCTKSGVPIYCFVITMAFPMLSFLQLSSSSSTVLHWLVNLVTAGCVIDYVVICITFLFFYRACRVQGIDRRTLPYYGYFQPYSAWAGLVGTVFVVLFYGYSSFAPWSVATFFTYYTMVLVAIATFSSWKLFKRTKVVPAHEADLVWERPSIDAYEATFEEEPVVSFWVEVLQMVDFRKVLKRK